MALTSEELPTLALPSRLSDICPYVSLRVFGEGDEQFFFGRDRVVKGEKGLLSALASSPDFLAVMGPSGSGKSSAIKAGLIPELKRGA